MKTLFDGVYAPSTVGTLLREFTFGHARQLESVLREHLVALCGRVDLLPGADERVFIDIDSLLRPVYGHAKQGASYGHTKIAGKQILRKGLSPAGDHDQHPRFGAGDRRDAATRRARPARARAPGGWSPRRSAPPAPPGPAARSWSAATRPTATARWCGRADAHGAQFSLVMTRNPAIDRAIAAIADDAWTPVSYPGAVRDPDTGAWISDAEVAEIPYTAFASTPDRITARLVVRRVKDACYPDALFPVWRYHPFFTNTDLPVEQADITHRQHAIIETVFADLIDGPLAHIPSGRFGANSAWVLCAAIAHNLLRAAGVLAGDRHARARGSTLRRRIVNVPARLARPQRRPVLHLPTHKGALYHHFDSQEALTTAIIEQDTSLTRDAFRHVCESSSPALENMIHGVFVVTDLLVSDKAARTAEQLTRGLPEFNSAASQVRDNMVRDNIWCSQDQISWGSRMPRSQSTVRLMPSVRSVSGFQPSTRPARVGSNALA